MNKRQKEVLTIGLNTERATLRRLQNVYADALDEVNAKIRELMLDDDMQSKIYQMRYQKALKKQLTTILNKMRRGAYNTIDEYLNDSYVRGFWGTLYSLQGEGIPLVLPIDQSKVTKAIQNNTRLSHRLYTQLGIDTRKLNDVIQMKVSQGIAQGKSYIDVARDINQSMNTGMNNSLRIARTEGHRIQNESAYDCMVEAKNNGADIVKQWDATMDSKVRPEHAELNGQIRNIDEPFEYNGAEAMYPGDFGIADMDINCRCVVLERASWAVSDEDNTYTKYDNENGVLIRDLSDYDDYESFVEHVSSLYGE